MFLGLDLGTSAVKALLMDANGNVVASRSSPLTVERPHQGWSEQDPESWWLATQKAVAELKQIDPSSLAAVRAIGLSGQMHGLTALDHAMKPLRAAILWNDARAAPQAERMDGTDPEFRRIGGNAVMHGFTAPKAVWMAENEPDLLAATRMILLPKDYLRLCLTGETVSEMSDAAGTLWLDVGARDWSDRLLERCGLTRDQMPRLVEEAPYPAGFARKSPRPGH